MQADHLIEAARLCAYALPSREAVWWAARCARATASAELKDQDRQACDLAEQWVRSRTDETRRSAMEKAQAAGFPHQKRGLPSRLFGAVTRCRRQISRRCRRHRI